MAYSKPTLSGYNSNPPPDDGTNSSLNEVTWAKHKVKLGDPLKTYADAINDAAENQFDAVDTSLSGKARHDDLFSDWVISGLIPATSANLTSDISAGSAYVTGRRITMPTTSRTYTASVDTYVDLSPSEAYVFSEVPNGDPAPAKAADDLRLAKVVTDASAITSVVDLRETVQRLWNYPRVVTPQMFGAVGDGVADDTTTLQAAIDAAALSGGGTVWVGEGTYSINARANTWTFTKGGATFPYGVRLKDNVTLQLAQGAVLQAQTVDTESQYAIVAIYEVTGARITGSGEIIGERDTHIGTAGEHGFGIDIRDSRRVHVEGVKISKCWGDGVYLAAPDPLDDTSRSEDIEIRGVTSDSNRRQGMSIVGAVDVRVVGGLYTNTQGTAPEAGIDLEPNSGQRNEGVSITGAHLTGNVIGLLTINSDQVAVSGCVFKDNTNRSLQPNSGIGVVSGCAFSGAPAQGHIALMASGEKKQFTIAHNEFDYSGAGPVVHSQGTGDLLGDLVIRSNTIRVGSAPGTSLLRSTATGTLWQFVDNTVVLPSDFATTNLTGGDLFVVQSAGWRVAGNTFINLSAAACEIVAAAGISGYFGQRNTHLGPITETSVVNGYHVRLHNEASVAAGATATLVIGFTGASLGDHVEVSLDVTQQLMLVFAYVSAADEITLVMQNNTGAAIDLPAANFQFKVTRP